MEPRRTVAKPVVTIAEVQRVKILRREVLAMQPDFRKERLDLFRRFFRIGCGEIGAPDAMLAQPRTHGAQERREHIRNPDAVEKPHETQHASDRTTEKSVHNSDAECAQAAAQSAERG